jgi:hypothetical protein
VSGLPKIREEKTLAVFESVLQQLHHIEVAQDLISEIGEQFGDFSSGEFGNRAAKFFEYTLDQLVEARVALDPVPDEQLEAELDAALIPVPSATDDGHTVGGCPIHAPQKFYRGDCSTCVWADIGGDPKNDGFVEVGPDDDPTVPLLDPEFDDFDEAWAAIKNKLAAGRESLNSHVEVQ